ncbi:MAG: hypothetical protein HY260_21660 [Chloroflexi bacterium]|nr:hypothetical protein [Chloroflexota bacterium]
MNARVREAPAPPVGVIDSIAQGFETVTGRLILILLPLALDVLLWLGPHLSINPIVQDVLDQFSRAKEIDPSVAPAAATWRLILTPIAQRFNLLSLLSVPAVPRLGCLPGAWCLPSLMALRAPIAIPGGQPPMIAIGNPLEMVTLIVAFYLIGLFLGAIYLGAIALQVRQEFGWPAVIRHVWGWWARLAAFAAIVVVAVLAFMTPVTLVALVASQLFGDLASAIVYFVGASVGLWGLFYLSFVVQAVLLQGRGLFGAIRDSFRVVRWNMPSTVALFVLIAALSFGLSVIWSVPSEDSWLTLIGIAGHAYVVTGLAAGTFVYYKDRYRWSSEFGEYLAALAEAAKKKKSS